MVGGIFGLEKWEEFVKDICFSFYLSFVWWLYGLIILKQSLFYPQLLQKAVIFSEEKNNDHWIRQRWSNAQPYKLEQAGS